MHTAYIGLGSNLGESEDILYRALDDIAALPQTVLDQVSDLYRTAPVDSSGPDYINAVARLTTELSAPKLLQALQAIELSHGRVRPYRNAPRTLDLDILCYDDLEQDTTQLILPHPRMHLRAFVLRPLLDIAPDMVLYGRPISQWLTQCDGQPVTLYRYYADRPD
ncbi:2-amino-4-hydroxy-6-hydroxymethyldihydropteridine diphosphokinase [Advenella sp. S44]|uniref:2-amino-4-hydroxy-6- hydroxymethyldihydropteridine diphosphokinase n=1 Tax=Advenella sp. S44 TaxID=1982755 RepID=UPI000C2979B4|nr:2-amino-4-hydroxy-6-hydroxymethyldihydropteridine diphosphokinase [Advenella sp. S44]PJX26647.1 2-amino-4-hydroxy-6-hydroxymethyldihydropteridine diphosphokinase [Advenella sp. S44]